MMIRIALIDNHDSFTYNIVELIRKVDSYNVLVDVLDTDDVVVSELKQYDAILLSPGPGLPKEAGRMMEVIDMYHKDKPILGICLGEQAIAEYFGGQLEHIGRVVHGVQSEISIMQDVRSSLFEEIGKSTVVGRYHSWVVSKRNFPEVLAVNSQLEDGTIMGICHKKYDVEGIQFHPESILTPYGIKMLENWIEKIKINKI